MEKENSETKKTLVPLEKRRDEARQYLLEYGIKECTESELDSLIDAPPIAYLRFIMKNLTAPDYLPKLAELLKTFKSVGYDYYTEYLSEDFVDYEESLVYDGENAIMWAASGELSYYKLKLLEDREKFIADYINAKSRDGSTALHHAVKSYTWYIIETIGLLDVWGANLNAQDDELMTPLHYVARMAWRNVFVELTERGAITNIKDKYGETQEDIAEDQNEMDAWC